MAFLMLSLPRSGTNVFCECLNTNPQVKAIFEVFHSQLVKSPDTYFNFIRETGNVEGAFPHNSTKMFLSYLEHLHNSSPDTRIVLDVKYYSVHHLNGLFHDPVSVPGLFSLPRGTISGVIHLKRYNPFRIYVSGQLAAARGIFHSAEGFPEVRVKLDPDRTIAAIELMLRNRKYIYTCIDALQVPVFEVNYEEMFIDDGQFSLKIMKDVAEFLGVDVRFNLTPRLLVSTPGNLNKVVDNYDDVTRRLRDEGYGDFVSDTAR